MAYQKYPLRDYRLELLKILDFFLNYCKENNYIVYPAGGTLLGAIRHKGFIPWDDDIDLCMERDEYERLCKDDKLINGIDGYVLKPFADSPNGWIFSKLFYTKIKQIDSNLTFVNGGMINIDIFPFDKYPKGKLKEKWVLWKCSKYRQFFNMARTFEYDTKGLRLLCDKIFCNLYRKIGIDFWCRKITKNATKYKESKNNKAVGLITFGLEKVPYPSLIDDIEIEFEGIKMKAFKGWDEYLTYTYGDYMTLPPENKRHNHHKEGIFLEYIN